MHALLSCFLLFLLTLVSATPLFDTLVTHEERSSVPTGFIKSGAAPPDDLLTLRIALAQGDMKGLEDALYDVSTPGSSNYGKHLSKAEVEALVRPSALTTFLVNEWLFLNGVQPSVISPAGDWLSITVPVSKANSLFGADFQVFTHNTTGKESIRTMNYKLPQNLREHVQFVHPTTTFESPFVTKPYFSVPFRPLIKANSTKRAQPPASCDSIVTPRCIQSLYNIPADMARQQSNTLGVSGFIGQHANQADLRQFILTLRPDLPSTMTFNALGLDGGSNPQRLDQAGIEANLDIQYTVGLAQGVPVTFVSVGDDNGDGLGGFLDIIVALMTLDTPPQVLTTSYGQDEALVSPEVAVNLCSAYMQLSARGTSIIFASGDGGVAGSRSQSCQNFVPSFPSGCPFVTSVGATQLSSGSESAAAFSGGGFSNVFARPAYQDSAVSRYLSSLPPSTSVSGRFNPDGRAFPDISSLGNNIEMVWQGQSGLIGGTSASAPIVASVVALLNDELAEQGKPPLGFLNPLLYSTEGALNDITTGSNPGCGTEGFPATSGWDPVTGLGSPDYAKLRAVVGL